MSKNIVMKEFNGNSFEEIYPKTTISQVNGLRTSSSKNYTTTIISGNQDLVTSEAVYLQLINNYYTKSEVDELIKQSERKDWALGKVITWDNKEWLICHIDYNVGFYLIANGIESKTRFGSNSTYAGSALASVAASYQTNKMSAAALAECVDITVNGVTAKVFVPSYEQFNGGFSWFTSDSRRIAQYGGSNIEYWTSSPYTSQDAWYVRASGSIGGSELSFSYGFRPCVCVQF